jgi:hypothetical protein
MNADDSLERGIADVYEREAPPRAPDWVLSSILDAIDATPQRRGLIPAPWRFRPMNTFAKAAIAAVVVIAIGAVGLSMLGPRSPSGVGGQPSASPIASPSPVPSSSPSLSPDTSAPPALSSTFTSTMHGIALSYPAGWAVSGATQNWTGGTVNFPSPDIDYLYDRALTSDLFLAVASQPLGGKSGETWMTDFLRDPEADCYTAGTPVTVDGANGFQCDTQVAIVVANRGYFIRLYTSDDHPELDTSYDSAWFRGLLDTVQLHPEKALDRPGSPSASPSG